MLNKSELKRKFSKEWEKHYKIDFLIDKGFKRKICSNCGKAFWTLDPNRKLCADPPCQAYDFIGNPPTKQRLGYIESWKTIENFFKKNGHKSLRRYPVVCRWYPLYFTIAGIIDFYRLEKGNLVFDFPANPSIVPQSCLRFNDIPNVGVTGRHYTSFVMVQQSSLYDGKQGYWKEKCIELDFDLLTKAFGINPEEIVFIEDAWVGPNAFGPSLEYFVRGLEIGNAVFTEFKQTNSGVQELEQKVIDMGAGLERFSWITQGTPTSYDVAFEPIIRYLKQQTGIEYDRNFFEKYSKLSGTLNMDEVKNMSKAKQTIAQKLGTTVELLEKRVSPLEAIYAIADHTLALTFAITDGMLPSNVGGGYNLRVILRRMLGFMDKFRWNLDLTKICEIHANHLKPIYPELIDHIDDIDKILEVEKKRYSNTKIRTQNIVKRIVENQEPLNEERLIKLYDSEGITPELVKTFVPDLKIPNDFYVKVTETHMKEKKKLKLTQEIDVSGLPPTKIMFYDEPDKYEFDAAILRIINNEWVVLDKTYFYPESGGQKSDIGFIGNAPVLNVQKIGNVVIHKILGSVKEGEYITCRVNKYRRDILKKHHTATHIVNTACREILGQHVWQHGAEKTAEKARLDITHYDTLTEKQVQDIENRANQIVEKKIPIKIEILERGDAEKKYGFRIYQGGAVPEKKLRIVSIGNLDHEACCGLHCNNTSEVGFISIFKTKRIQDGIVRLEFASGEVALKQLKEKEKILKEVTKKLGVKEDDVPKKVQELFNTWKMLRKKK